MTTEIDRFPHGLLDFHNFMVEQWLLFCGGRLFCQRIANFATDKIDGVVCATRRGVQYFACTKRHQVSEQVLKPPLSNGLFIIALTTMSFEFPGRLNAAIDGSFKGQPIFS